MPSLDDGLSMLSSLSSQLVSPFSNYFGFGFFYCVCVCIYIYIYIKKTNSKYFNISKSTDADLLKSNAVLYSLMKILVSNKMYLDILKPLCSS
jgi:hypothetical protein